MTDLQVEASRRSLAASDNKAGELVGRMVGPWRVEGTFRNNQNRNVFLVKHTRTGEVRGLRGHELTRLAHSAELNGL